ncbi:hypothetical protein BDW59DRAFT_180324 [Aspergillus cavernicola]|uniref:ADP-ribose 1''-phosphate phosphatase n=1 Tax=Aspergillus cavernicola TaxID=176166 RepID=A0ABR4I9A4_9EURO
MIACDYPGCTAQYRRKEHLTRHARKHNPGGQPLTCEQCHKSFDRTDTLRRHRQLHLREQGESSLPRTSKACDQCHFSKTRCDGKSPCNVCSRRQVSCNFHRQSRRRVTREATQPASEAVSEGSDISHGHSQDVLDFNTLFERIERDGLVGEVDESELLRILDDRQENVALPNSESTRACDSTRDQVSDNSQCIKRLILRHEHHLRNQGLLARADAAQTVGPQAETPELDIQYHVDIYFSHFHHQWPIIHRVSSKPNQPQILLLTMAMIGLWVTGEKASRSRAEKMHEKLLNLLDSRMDDWKLASEFKDQAWPMTTYQAILLNIIFALIREAPPDLHERCSSMLNDLTTTCITGGLFSYETMRAQLSPTDSLLFSWTYIQETQRLALAVFKLNMFFNTGLLSVSDLRFPLPDNDYLWDAPRSKEFYRRYHAQLDSGTGSGHGPHICDVFRDVQQGRRWGGLLLQTDSWLGFLALEHARFNRDLTLENAVSRLSKTKFNTHGECNHGKSHWIQGMDTWGQLETLRGLLCQYDPSVSISPDLLSDIDAVIAHRNSHRLLTSSASIFPRVVIGEGPQTRLSIWRGDITALTDVTAIVNAANSQLLGCFQPAHRCIDNVIHSAAGPRLRQACYELMVKQGHDEPVGQAKVTPGYNLPASNVIHTVGPQLKRGQLPDAIHRRQLSDCYISCLKAAEGLPALSDGRKVLVFCCISTGIFAFPSDTAAEIALTAVFQWCLEHPETTVTDIVFDTFLQSDWEIYNDKISLLPFPDDNDQVVKTAANLPPPKHIVPQAVATARAWLQEADYLIITAGAGLSAATGLDYTSPDLFAKHFSAFLPLGLRRLYDAFGFDRWKSPAQKWGYCFHQLNLVRTWPASPLYAALREIANQFTTRCFIRTSNADGLFLANGFHPSRISTPQGQYAFLQCLAKCRREAVFPSAPFLEKALPFLDSETQCLTDESKIPSCRYCGGEMTLCVRGGDYFNSSPFRGQEREYNRFVDRVTSAINTGYTHSNSTATAVILELGVGLNTPSVLRWPNEDLVDTAPNGGFRLIRAGLDASGCAPWELEQEGLAVGISGDLKAVVEMLGRGERGSR